jgi:hypothetical protein
LAAHACSTEAAGFTPQYGFAVPGERVAARLENESSKYQAQKLMGQLVQAARAVKFLCDRLPEEYCAKARR